MFKVCGIIGISKIEFCKFFGTDRVKFCLCFKTATSTFALRCPIEQVLADKVNYIF